MQKYLSYMTGWLTMTGWQSAITGIGMLIATIIQGLVVLNNPEYTPERWHSTLMVIAVVAVCVGFNTFLARRLPLIEGTLAILHFAGLFVIIIILYVMPPRLRLSQCHQLRHICRASKELPHLPRRIADLKR